MTPSPTPEEGTMVSNEPSAEAKVAAFLAMAHRYSSREVAERALAAAYRIDAPAIHAAGVAEGRAAMRDEIVAWVSDARWFDTRSVRGELADAIEAAFPTTGGQTDG